MLTRFFWGVDFFWYPARKGAGGVKHRDRTKNGRFEKKTLEMASCDGGM
jgi:hypothetical protein